MESAALIVKERSAQKEESIVNLSSEVKESKIKIKNVSKDFKEKMAELQEGLKNQKYLLEEQRVTRPTTSFDSAREKRAKVDPNVREAVGICRSFRKLLECHHIID
ncbi:hypothetical protein L5515_017554 [Caenorhabditis briggsae]|uniref:Uncharacterized protein n=1 Tax=Caenorhabditis briggsae TaxID=6238 RepID=A0AAE9JRQ1_CAEBR|nr:hypothetical protein L5515_017554 [Caenorhabditis briggsae]